MTSLNDTNSRNRKFIEAYELKNDGTLADRLMAGCKRAIAEEFALTSTQREEQRLQYKKKMAEIVNSAAKDWPV